MMRKVIASILSLTILFGSLRNVSFAESPPISSIKQTEIPKSLLDTTMKEETLKKAIENNPHIEARVKDIKEILVLYKSEKDNYKKYTLIRNKISSINEEIKSLEKYKFKEDEINSANLVEQIVDIKNKLKSFKIEKQYLEILLSTSSKPFTLTLLDICKEVSFLALFWFLLCFGGENIFNLYKIERSWLGIKSIHIK